MAIRKDANTLSSSERAEFVNAVKTLKTSGIYDSFVLRHANAIMSAIHRCPAFLSSDPNCIKRSVQAK